MKTTTVYRGPGYPIDPKREAARQGEYRCVMIPPPESPLNLEEVFDWVHRFRESHPQRDTIEVVIGGVHGYLESVQTNPKVTNTHVDRMIQDIDRDERKRRQKEIGQMFVKGEPFPDWWQRMPEVEI